jgi:hypothetical protein
MRQPAGYGAAASCSAAAAAEIARQLCDTCGRRRTDAQARVRGARYRRGMRVQELKQRVQRADYVIDPGLVATALIRHAISYRRCWNPRTVCGTPAVLSTSSGGPSLTLPIQVRGAADSAAGPSSRATQKHNS